MEYTCKEEKSEVRYTSDNYYLGKLKKTWIICLGLFCISIGGGVILGWWSLKFHLSNRQLWMVPLGLILLVTPILIFLAILLESCNYRETGDQHHLESVSQDFPQDLERSF